MESTNNASPAASAHQPTSASPASTAVRSGETDIASFENRIPAFAAAEIDRLHGHLYCSLSYLEMTGQATGASTYVVREAGTPAAVLLFKREGNEVIVVSDFVKLDEDQIRRFAAYVFAAFGTVSVVSFSRIRTDCRRLPYPLHAVRCTEDMIVALPPTVEEYEARVGKNMRRNIKRYTSALQRDFPSYAYNVCESPNVSEPDIRDLIRLGRIRMESKNIVPRYTEEETRWIVQLAQECGLVGIARIDGRVCGGAIGFRIGENYFMHVIAHDPAFNQYSLGILCYYHTICAGIARGGKAFHLLQGRYGYKGRLLAEREDVLHLDVYRNRWQVIAHSRRIVKKAFDGGMLATRQWLLHDVERSASPALRLLGRAVNALRRRKRAAGSGVANDMST